MNSKSVDEEQDARSFLRERYLRALSGLVGRKCQFWMHECASVEGIFKGCDLYGERLLVSELRTYLGIVPNSLLRTTDVITFTANAIEED